MAQRNRHYSRSGLSLMNPDAAGIDIDSAAHYVAVPVERDDEPVREFASFTADLNALADWLERCEIKIVAMESTGVYWIPLYELLQRRGFEVLLVNARHVKNVSGRKSDVLDCQWLRQLLSFGLLRSAFRSDDKVCELRSITRQRAMLLRSQGRQVQHMQKALTQINIQLANVISDIAGVTGQKIVREIVSGERDPQELAGYRDIRIKASEQEIVKSLQGNWRAEHLFALKQVVAGFDFCVSQLLECDTETQRVLEELHAFEGPPAKGKKRGRSRNAPKFDVREHLFKVCGMDRPCAVAQRQVSALVLAPASLAPPALARLATGHGGRADAGAESRNTMLLPATKRWRRLEWSTNFKSKSNFRVLHTIWRSGRCVCARSSRPTWRPG